MKQSKWTTMTAVAVLAAGLAITGCSKKPAEKKAEPVPAAQTTAPEQAASTAPAAPGATFDQLCGTMVDKKKEIYKTQPYKDEEYAKFKQDCIDEWAPHKSMEADVAGKILKACEKEDPATAWDVCYEAQKAEALKAKM